MARLVPALLLGFLVACGSPSTAPQKGPVSTTNAASATPSAPPISLTPAPTPTPLTTVAATATAKPLAIGDPCLVGRWTLTSLVILDGTIFSGVTMRITGQVGTVMTLTADGTETFDLTNSTPLSGSGGGHTISWTGRGVQRFGFYGESGKWTESGAPQTATATNVVIDGVRQPDFTNTAPPLSGTYTCSGSDLTVGVALPGYSQTATFKK